MDLVGSKDREGGPIELHAVNIGTTASGPRISERNRHTFGKFLSAALKCDENGAHSISICASSKNTMLTDRFVFSS